MYSREITTNSQNNPHYNRYLELLEALKKEYEALAFDSSAANIGLRAYREELEQKIQTQLNEVAFMQKTIVELERAYLKMKASYEDEINRLRKELESRTLTSQVTLGFSNTNVPAIPAFIMNTNLPNHTPGSVISLPQIDSASQPPSKRTRIEDATISNQQASPHSTSGLLSGNKSPHVSTPHSGSSNYPGGTGSGLMQSNSSVMDAEYEVRLKQSVVLNQMQGGYSNASQPRNYPIGVIPSGPGGSYGMRRSPSIDVPPSSALNLQSWQVIYNSELFKSIEINLKEIFDHREVVSCVKFSPNGALLATGSNKLISLFDTISCSLYAELEIPNHSDKDIFIRAVSFSPDSKQLAIGSEDCLTRIWDLDTRRIVHSISCHKQEVYAVEYTPDGRYVVTGSGDRTIKIVDIKQGEPVATLDAFPMLSSHEFKEFGITSIAVSSDGSLIAPGCVDKIIRIWQFSTKKLICSLEGHVNPIYSLSFSPDSRYIASGSLDKTIILWERQFGEDNSITSAESQVACISFKIKNEILCHNHYVLCVTFTADSKYIVSCSKDNTIHVWNVAANTTQLILKGHTDTVFSVSISPDSKLLASGSGDKSARIWELSTFDLDYNSNDSETPKQPSVAAL